MKPRQRQEQILQRLRALPREWQVEELARALKVSALTIRRDLEELARGGLILRTHGGCLDSGRGAAASDYQRRVAVNFELKQAIGAEAARQVRAHNALLINDGSTCFHLASCLGRGGALTVYTNSIIMLSELSRFANVRLYVLGGEYQAASACLGGSLLEEALEDIAADLVFLGTDAVDAQGRCLVLDQDTARVARVMLRHARRRILLADHTKAAAPGQVAYASLPDFDLWITTAGLPGGLRRRYLKQTLIKEVRI